MAFCDNVLGRVCYTQQIWAHLALSCLFPRLFNNHTLGFCQRIRIEFFMKPPLLSLKLAVRKCQSYDVAKTRVIPLVKLEHQSYPIRRDEKMVKRIVKSYRWFYKLNPSILLSKAKIAFSCKIKLMFQTNTINSAKIVC